MKKLGFTPKQAKVIEEIRSVTEVLESWPASNASVCGCMTENYDINIENDDTIVVTFLNRQLKTEVVLKTKVISELLDFLKANKVNA